MRGAKGQNKKKGMPEPRISRTTKDDLPYIEQERAPEPLFIEKKVTRPLSEPIATRILHDGTCWTFFDWAMIPKDRYYHLAKHLPRKWRWDGERLTEEELDNLKDLIRKKIMSLPSEIPIGEGGVIGGTDVYWTIELDGKRHTIHWVQGGDPKPPALEQFDSMLTDYGNNAIERWRHQYGDRIKSEDPKSLF